MELNGKPLTPELEAALLDTLPPNLLLDWLREQGPLAQRLFAGFRATKAGLRHPVVRQRLQRELETEADLADALASFWGEVHAPELTEIPAAPPAEAALRLAAIRSAWGDAAVALFLLALGWEEVPAAPEQEEAGQAAAPEPAAPENAPPADAKPRAAEEKRVEQLRRQVRSLRDELAAQEREAHRLQRQAEQAQAAAEKWRAAAEESARDAREHRRAAERLLRQHERLLKERAELEGKLQENERAHRRLAHEVELDRRRQQEKERLLAESRRILPEAESWLEAARALVRTGQAQSAVNLLAQLAGTHPEAPAVREALAEAYQALGAVPAAVTELCWLARWRQRSGSAGQALRPAFAALALAPEDPGARRCLREVLAGLADRAEEVAPDVARSLHSLAQQSPAAHRAALALLPEPFRSRQQAPALDLDTPIEWRNGQGTFRASLRAVIEAIDANRVEMVERVRAALAALRSQEPARYREIVAAVRQADRSYAYVLSGRSRPIVVDGSNVAWHRSDGSGLHAGAPMRPRLAHLETIRRELHGLGYFPVRLIVDAALIHQIDQRPQLERLVARGEVELADAGTDADEQILREARALGSAVVTNDRMLEHDPENKVRKLHFDVGPDGAAVWQ